MPFKKPMAANDKNNFHWLGGFISSPILQIGGLKVFNNYQQQGTEQKIFLIFMIFLKLDEKNRLSIFTAKKY